MYAREIAGTEAEEYRDAQYDCAACEASTHEWTLRGRCTGPVLDVGGRSGKAVLAIIQDGKTDGEFPDSWETCPRALLRPDLHPDEVAVSTLVSHAAAAEVDKRWPDVPAKLYGLLGEWRRAEAGKMRAEHEARMNGVRHGSR